MKYVLPQTNFWRMEKCLCFLFFPLSIQKTFADSFSLCDTKEGRDEPTPGPFIVDKMKAQAAGLC